MQCDSKMDMSAQDHTNTPINSYPMCNPEYMSWTEGYTNTPINSYTIYKMVKC